jgi:hypothetical protein
VTRLAVFVYKLAMISIGPISTSPPADAIPKRIQSCSDSEAFRATVLDIPGNCGLS